MTPPAPAAPAPPSPPAAGPPRATGDADAAPGPGRGAAARLRTLPARGAMFLIELYRTYVSPMRAPTCRFTPTCSEYAVEALREWGLLRGLALTSWRLLKCGPWYPGGWDPVPPRHGGRPRRPAGTPAGDHREASAEGGRPRRHR